MVDVLHGRCPFAGWNAWDSSSYCRVVAGVQGGLGRLKLGQHIVMSSPFRALVWSACPWCLSNIINVKHSNNVFFMVYVVGCYDNDCLDNCSSLSLSDVLSCWKANEYSYLNFLSIFFLTFFHHMSILCLSLSHAVFTTWSKSFFLKSLW